MATADALTAVSATDAARLAIVLPAHGATPQPAQSIRAVADGVAHSTTTRATIHLAVQGHTLHQTAEHAVSATAVSEAAAALAVADVASEAAVVAASEVVAVVTSVAAAGNTTTL